MRTLLFAVVFVAGIAVPASADDAVDFEKANPEFVFVSDVNTEKGLLTLKRRSPVSIPVNEEVSATKDGKTFKQVVTTHQVVFKTEMWSTAFSKLAVITAGGKTVDVADFATMKGKTILYLPSGALPGTYRSVLDKNAIIVSPKPVAKP